MMVSSRSTPREPTEDVRSHPEVGFDLVHLFDEELENLALPSVLEEQIANFDSVLLTVAVEATHPLVDPSRVPREVVVDHEMGEL